VQGVAQAPASQRVVGGWLYTRASPPFGRSSYPTRIHRALEGGGILEQESPPAVWAPAWHRSVSSFVGMCWFLARVHAVCCCYDRTLFLLHHPLPAPSASPPLPVPIQLQPTLPLHSNSLMVPSASRSATCGSRSDDFTPRRPSPCPPFPTAHTAYPTAGHEAPISIVSRHALR
jgi:hypothetical protein